MIRGTDVTVIRRTMMGRDEMGEPIFAESSEMVGNVLITPSTTDEMDEANRAFGVSCELTLHFPKTYTGSLQDCHVLLPPPWGDGIAAITGTTTTTIYIPDGEYRVLGDPKPYMPENTPTPWNRAAKVARADG